MKKIVAMMLALMLVLVSVSAMAANHGTRNSSAFEPDPDIASTQTITIKKGYTLNGADISTTGTAKHPADVLTFTATSKYYYINGVKDTSVAVPDLTNLAVTPVNEDNAQATISFKLPNYTGKPVGEYIYYLTEADGKTAGVTYNYTTENPLVLKVTLVYETDSDGKPTDTIIIGGIALRDGGEGGENPANANDSTEKLDSTTGSKDDVHNDYEMGSLTIDKKVTGNMGDTTKDWIFKVDFIPEAGTTVRGTISVTKTSDAVYCGELETPPTADEFGNVSGAPAAAKNEIDTGWTATSPKTVYFTLQDGDSIKFDNIPKGVSYKITELEAGMYLYKTNVAASTTTDVKEAETKEKTEMATIAQVEGKIDTAAEPATATYTNDNSLNPDTGIGLDTVPYLMIMAIALMGVAMMIVRRREEM